MSDINLLERELIDAVEKKGDSLGVESKDIKRMARIVANRLNLIRSYLSAERIAERSGYQVTRGER